MKSNLRFTLVAAGLPLAAVLLVTTGQSAKAQTSYLDRVGKECSELRSTRDDLDERKDLIWQESVQIETKAETALGLELVKIPGIDAFVRNYRLELASKELQVFEESLAAIKSQDLQRLSTFLKKKRVVVESFAFSKGARKSFWPGGACGVSSYELGTPLKFPDPVPFFRDDVRSTLGLSEVKASKPYECLNAIDSALVMLESSNPVPFRERMMRDKTAKLTARLNKSYPQQFLGAFVWSALNKCRAPIACSDQAIVAKLNEAVEPEKANLVRVQSMRLAHESLDAQVRELGFKLNSKRIEVESFLDRSTKPKPEKHDCIEAE